MEKLKGDRYCPTSLMVIQLLSAPYGTYTYVLRVTHNNSSRKQGVTKRQCVLVSPVAAWSSAAWLRC